MTYWLGFSEIGRGELRRAYTSLGVYDVVKVMRAPRGRSPICFGTESSNLGITHLSSLISHFSFLMHTCTRVSNGFGLLINLQVMIRPS